MDVLVEDHVDEHDEEDERVRPRAVGDELLDEACTAPAAVPDPIQELPDGERKEDCLERERDDPEEPCERLTCRAC